VTAPSPRPTREQESTPDLLGALADSLVRAPRPTAAVIEHVTGVVATDEADGRIRLSRIDGTIIGPRSIARPHALTTPPEEPIMAEQPRPTREQVEAALRRVCAALLAGAFGADAEDVDVLAAEVRALRVDAERHAADAHQQAGLASRLRDELADAGDSLRQAVVHNHAQVQRLRARVAELEAEEVRIEWGVRDSDGSVYLCGAGAEGERSARNYAELPPQHISTVVRRRIFVGDSSWTEVAR
jgi:hypothetical protein